MAVASGLLFATVAAAQQFEVPPRGPLARLVRTPDDGAGLPPYALADQSGNIQRYVEPVAGIDLEPHLDQIVTVRHDTGETLLASQLELPSQKSLLPLVGEDFARLAMGSRPSSVKKARKPRVVDRFVEQAEYVDNDDSTVELMEEGEVVQGGPGMPAGVVPEGAIYPDGSPVYPASPGMPMMQGGMSYGAMPGGTMPGGPMIEAYPSDYGPYPAYGQNMGFVQPFGQPVNQPPRVRPHIYGDVEINFLRAHVNEEVFGKLSEKYEFSPRFVIGFTDVGTLSGRVRYWIYGRGTNGLSDDDDVHIDFDVWDVEATHLISGKRSEVMLAAGVRFANIEITDNETDAAGADLVGLTLAGDGWTPLFTCEQGCFGWTYGGRFSILAGDWAGDDDSAVLDERVRDDNVLVHELYAGVGFTKCCRGMDLNARLVFEMQNWHSDVLSDTADGTIGFVGPGVHVGAEF
jgi:hypothetical protein